MSLGVSHETIYRTLFDSGPWGVAQWSSQPASERDERGDAHTSGQSNLVLAGSGT
jgi:hypothetical protein